MTEEQEPIRKDEAVFLAINAAKENIIEATAGLMQLLQGIELLRISTRTPKPASGMYFADQGMPTHLDLSWFLLDRDGKHTGARRAALGGSTEQIALIAWVVDVYNRVWEGGGRQEIEEAFHATGISNEMRVRIDAFGDLRQVRNDLVHNRRRADKSTKNKVLRRFHRGDTIILTMGDVYNFLNHAYCLEAGCRILQAPLRDPAPQICSVLDTADSTRVVFDTGLYIDLASSVEAEETLLSRTEKTEDGDLRLRTGKLVMREEIYKRAVKQAWTGGQRLDIETASMMPLRLERGEGPRGGTDSDGGGTG